MLIVGGEPTSHGGSSADSRITAVHIEAAVNASVNPAALRIRVILLIARVWHGKKPGPGQRGLPDARPGLMATPPSMHLNARGGLRLLQQGGAGEKYSLREMDRPGSNVFTPSMLKREKFGA